MALLVPTVWGLVLFPVAVLLVFWGAIRREELFLHERFGASTTTTPAECGAGL
jgi:protein-S-isoprenylcysteine O-methyltransferase Ste14